MGFLFKEKRMPKAPVPMPHNGTKQNRATKCPEMYKVLRVFNYCGIISANQISLISSGIRWHS